MIIRLIITIIIGISIATGGAFATQSLLSGTPGGGSLYQYGVR
jgi:hypothetical protein